MHINYTEIIIIIIHYNQEPKGLWAIVTEQESKPGTQEEKREVGDREKARAKGK